MSDLPEGWTAQALGSIADCRLGKMLDAAKNRGELRPYLRNTNVQWGTIDLSDIKEIRIEDDERDRYAVLPGDLLVCEGGEPGRCAVWRDDREMYLQKALHRVRPLNGTSAEYLRWFLQHATSNGALENLYTGSTIKHLPGRQLAQIIVPAPAADEQQRIASWLQEIDVRRASIVNRLTAAHAIVDRLRSAILAAACSGRLTADWHGADAEADDEGAAGVPDGAIDLPLPGLPAAYKVSTVGALSERIEYGTSKKAQADGEVPVLRMGNIQDGRLVTSDLKFLPSDREVERLLLADGDLLFNRTNSPDLVGKTAVFHGSQPMTFASYLIRVKFRTDLIDPDFVGMWLNSAWGKAWARHVKTDGVSQSNINGTKLGAMPVPLPPLEEQAEIVRRATAALKVADGVATAIATADRSVDDAMRGALAKAFRGELVPTDAELIIATSEPAFRNAERSAVMSP